MLVVVMMRYHLVCFFCVAMLLLFLFCYYLLLVTVRTAAVIGAVHGSRFTVHGAAVAAHIVRCVRSCGSRPSIVPPHATFEHEFLIEGGEEQRKEIVTCVPPLFTHHTSHIQYTPTSKHYIIIIY